MPQLSACNLNHKVFSVKFSFSFMQNLKSMGVALFCLGTLLIIISRIPHKTIVKRQDFHFQLTARRIFVDKFASPSFLSEFHIIFAEKPRNKIRFTLEHMVSRSNGGFVRGGSSTKFETHRIVPGGIKAQKKATFSLNPDPTCEYLVHAEVIDGLKKEGYEKILSIFQKYGFHVQLEKELHIVPKGEWRIFSDTEGENFDICFADFSKNCLRLFHTNLRGDNLYHELKISKYRKTIEIWHEKYPDLLDEIADAVVKYSEKVESDCSFEILRVDYVGDWLFHIGLTILTISVVVYFAK